MVYVFECPQCGIVRNGYKVVTVIEERKALVTSHPYSESGNVIGIASTSTDTSRNEVFCNTCNALLNINEEVSCRHETDDSVWDIISAEQAVRKCKVCDETQQGTLKPDFTESQSVEMIAGIAIPLEG